MLLKKLSLTGIFLTFLLISNVFGALEPIEELTFDVPGLSGPIEQFVFNDINNDDFPEVLATDGTILVLYSIGLDSILFADTIPASADSLVNYKILFDDVNRDSLPDIMVARSIIVVDFMFPDTAKMGYDIFYYDYSTQFTRIYFEPVYSDLFIGYFAPIFGRYGIKELKAFDFNNDGYNELLFSFESLNFVDMGYTLIYLETGGTTVCYHSFPDTILWSASKIYSKFVQISDSHFVTNSYYNVSADSHASGQEKIVTENVVLISKHGNVLSNLVPIVPLEVSCYDRLAADIYNKTQFRCTGNMIDTEEDIEILSTLNYWHGLTCYENGDFINVDTSGAKLILQKLVAPDSVEEVWSIDIVGHTYTDFVYHPLAEGYFFAFEGDTLFQFKGTDGSFYQKNDTLPSGSRQWVFPYDDELPRLSILDSNNIKLIGFDISTGVDDYFNNNLPTSFTISQNYPNPFNPSTTVSYRLPTKGDVLVEVYNILGQKVITLVDKKQPAGEYAVSWDASEQSSGIYLFQVSYQDQIKSIKTLLLK